MAAALTAGCGCRPRRGHLSLPARAQAARRLSAGHLGLALDRRRPPPCRCCIALPGLSFTGAFFETMSGLTTTGSTVLNGLDALPPSLNFWRHLLEWLGRPGHHRHGARRAAAAQALAACSSTRRRRRAVKEERLTPRITRNRQEPVARVRAAHAGPASSACACAACPGSTRSVTPSPRSVSAASPPTTAASPTSTPRRSSSCSWC